MSVSTGRWAGGGALRLLIVAALLPRPAPAQSQKSELRLVLNVPENRLYVYEGAEPVERYRVSVGMDGYETPPGEYRITHAIWNPWWHPPDSRWARGRKVEPPGPHNPMGRVKLHFSQLLYIHGTTEEAWLGRPASRGCVRMANDDLIELARLLHRRASPRVSARLLQQLVEHPKQTRKIDLTRPVPFAVVYRVAEVRDGNLHIFPDVYDRIGGSLEDQVLEVLRKHGVQPSTVDRAKLQRLVHKARTTKVSMSLDTLTTPSEPHAATGGER
jgi:murein L,D-transpeptidase YcbB/YkuD